MYSLYRAWLSLGPCAAPPTLASPFPVPSMPLNLSLPTPVNQVPDAPDVTVQVGPTMTHFSAHKGVLCAHSGFFKAALANHAGTIPITVPNINVDEFSSLLTFMYTGYLDLNIANIYNILLATHILHMPRALELCRTFLVQQNQNNLELNEGVQRVNVVKPIASRKMVPSMQEAFGQGVFCQLKKSEESVFRSVSKEVEASTSKIEELPKVEKKIVPKSNHAKKKQENSTAKDNVIIDVACCDGPVRFHRVINKNYGVQDAENFDSNSNHSFQTTELTRSNALHKAMNENIMEKMNQEAQSNEVFTCVYCNHTFKSQYCYQKHARRHLYPVGVDKIAQAEAKREVKLLDMNVQYYPCKTCGSKFPSYYFVHKHRKMCHAEEVADKNNKNNEIVVENGIPDNENSSCSAIDVEGVQNENEEAVT